MFKNKKNIKYINKNQSLKYQVMLILMEEHKKARLGNDNKGLYLGDNRLIFDTDHWLKMKKEIKKMVSESYKEMFLEMSDNQILQMMEGNDLFTFEIKEYARGKPTVIFEMLDSGYSYQYNGYKRSVEKLQKTANTILLATLGYYILSLLLDHIGKFKTFFKMIGDFLKAINIKSEIIPTILLVIVGIAAIAISIKWILKKIKDCN